MKIAEFIAKSSKLRNFRKSSQIIITTANFFRVFLNASYYFSRHLKALSISLLNLKVIFNVMTLFVQTS